MTLIGTSTGSRANSSRADSARVSDFPGEVAGALSAASRLVADIAARWLAVETAVDRAAASGGAVALGPVAVDAGALQRVAQAAFAWVVAWANNSGQAEE